MQKIEISSKTIIFTVLFLLFLNFLWLVRELIFSLFIAFIIMSALKPLVAFLERKKIPRMIGACIAYIVFLGTFIEILSFIFPPFISETILLFKNFPSIIESIIPNVWRMDLSFVAQYIPNITGEVFNVARIIFSNAIFTISTIFFGFYFLVEENPIKNFLTQFFSDEKTNRVVSIFEKVEKRMSAWFWGELILMVVVGLLTFFGLNLIGIKYVIPLAVLAGLLEVVPNLGPVISAIVAALIGFSQSYMIGVATLALGFIVQQLENNLIVPYVMKKAVGLNPIITLIALVVGGKLAGVLGVLLAIPISLFIETVLVEILASKRIPA